MTDKPKCLARVPNDGGWGFRQCSNTATRDGWCGKHHPEAEALRRNKAEAKTAAWLSERKRERERVTAMHDLMSFGRSFLSEMPEPARAIIERYIANMEP